ncbi:MAG TPA: ABC transporter permease [Microbacteriaceae bacterium]|nr:ABC transporter permease [Microbacteriaceae bacterium]
MRGESTWSKWFSAATSSGAAVWAVVIILFVLGLAFANGFGTPENLNNISRQGVALAILALAQFLVVLTGEVDLSIAANARLSAIVMAIMMDGSNDNLPLALLTALGIGIGIGALNALLVVVLRIESFIATLGVSAIVAGLALFIAPTPRGRSAPALQEFYSAQIAGGVFVVVVVVAALWVLSWFMLRRTVWGRHVYATGGNPHAAGLSGISTAWTRTSTYLISGVLSAFAGVVILAGTGVGDNSAASGLEFTALAIAVIGGASLAGGRGKLLGLLGGVVLFAMIGNVFNLLRIEVWYQQLVRGAIILIAAAVFVDRVRGGIIRRPSTAPRRDKPADTDATATEGASQWR